VETGDTIWNLAERYLGDGHRADEIAAANPGIKDPVKALPLGKEIVIPAK
ncbi:MAG TPA: LysM peptidoglycan-binding domain-containing protein, partial [Phycisphaerae bacterium]|nr:LysM peptidoglycan-binding domain-containing protein [Phycisphaerae bacterium]